MTTKSEVSHPTQDLLKELFDYQDGELFWKVSKGSRANIGYRAGSVIRSGYLHVMINGKHYYNHRLIFLYHHGYLPEFLDHIDGDSLNNDISNLRVATQQENCRNKKKGKSINGKSTTSNFKGVTWDKQHQKWMSYIFVGGKRKHLGRFVSEIDAAKAYNKAATKSFGEFARLNIFDGFGAFINSLSVCIE